MTATHYPDATGVAQPMHRAHTLGDPGAPLPLTRRDAIARAAELNRRGVDFDAVAVVMGEYHGWYLSRCAWWSSVVKWHGNGRGEDVRPHQQEHKP